MRRSLGVDDGFADQVEVLLVELGFFLPLCSATLSSAPTLVVGGASLAVVVVLALDDEAFANLGARDVSHGCVVVKGSPVQW